MYMTPLHELHSILGSTIKIGPYTYQEVGQRPKGLRKLKTLTQLQAKEGAEQETYIIYGQTLPKKPE